MLCVTVGCKPATDAAKAPAPVAPPTGNAGPATIAVMAVMAGLPAAGPLAVKAPNARYFSDPLGRPVLLTGSHTWATMQDIGHGFPPVRFDFGNYLDTLAGEGHNFIRLWTWEQSRWSLDTPDDDLWIDPPVFPRTGPGLALDGRPRFDLSHPDPEFLRRLRERVVLAGGRGMYVSVMLFNGWSVASDKGGFHHANPWRGHPFNAANNINSIDGDINHDGSGEEVHELVNPRVLEIQEQYVREVVARLNDLDNVLFEISNESHTGSLPWQRHIVGFIRQVEAGLPKQHPVGITSPWPHGVNEDSLASAADWISPNGSSDNPLVFPPGQVILADTDHLCGICGDGPWVWRAFMRGQNPIFMDPWDGVVFDVAAVGGTPMHDTRWADARRAMGLAAGLARRAGLAGMDPHPELASTGYCLARPVKGDAQYFVYVPWQAATTVDLTPTRGDLASEWLNLDTGARQVAGRVPGSGLRQLENPFDTSAVLWLRTIRQP